MAGFVGQEHLFQVINDYSLSTLPHTLLLLGEEGCGKKTIVKYLANKLGFGLTELDNKVDPDKLTEYQQKPLKTLYLIDLSKFTLEKEQNQFLKFIEEPSDSVYVALINDSEIGVLPTILNRCVKLRFEPYTVEQLRQIREFKSDLAYKVCRTPGQLNSLDEKKLQDMKNTCDKLISSIHAAQYAATIAVEAKINYKEEYHKYDFQTFFNMLEYVAVDRFIHEKDVMAMKIYLYTMKYRQKMTQNSNIAKEPYMIAFLDGLWKETR